MDGKQAKGHIDTFLLTMNSYHSRLNLLDEVYENEYSQSPKMIYYGN